MTPEMTARLLTARHDVILDELDEALGDTKPSDSLRELIERHRSAIHSSVFWLLDETSARPSLRRRYLRLTNRVRARLRTLRAVGSRGRTMRKETRRMLRAWLSTIDELVDAAVHETTNAGRELLVRAYRRADQLAGKRMLSSVPAELD